ncbi:MAG: CapA family protein [Bacteroidia bacterium]
MKVLTTGDFYPGLRMEAVLNDDPAAILGNFSELIEASDLAIVNLEAPLTDHTEPIRKTGPALKGSHEAAGFLKRAGFGLATLANNHILDYGGVGVKDTLEILGTADMDHIGAGMGHNEAAAWYIHEDQGKKLAVLNFAENEWSTTYNDSPGANPVDPVLNSRYIKAASAKADHVLVISHGGHEMYQYPSPRMKDLFRFYVECGANAVVNHHPHCTSGFEVFQGAPIFYSTGNFLFDHKVHKHAIWNKGLAVMLTFKNDQIGFEMHHFDQCNEKPGLTLCDLEEQNLRNNEIARINKVIQSDKALNASFQQWISKHKKNYLSYIEPHKSRYIQAMQNRGWMPSLWNRRKKEYLLNLIRCEAHHDILKAILQDEISHP